MSRRWLCCCLVLGACASGPSLGGSGELGAVRASRDGPDATRHAAAPCPVALSRLDDLEVRASRRFLVPQLRLSVESVERPGFDAAWVRPIYGPERVRRTPVWRRDVVAIASLRWDLDGLVVVPTQLAALRARRVRVLARGACPGGHDVW